NILGDILVHLELVRHSSQCIESHVDFRLTSRRNFMVMHFHLNSDALERQDDFGSDILEVIHRGDGEVALFISRLVAQIWAFLFAGIPEARLRVDVVKTVIETLIEPDIVENEELRFRTKVDGVANAGRLKVLFRLLCDEARIPRIWPVSDGILYIANHIQGGCFRKRIHECGIRIWHEEHVAFLNLLKTANARAIEA